MNETLVKIMLKNLGVEPDALKAQATHGFELVKRTAQRIEQIELMLTAICAKLDIPIPAQDKTHVDDDAA